MPYEQSTAPPRQQQQNSQKHGLATRSERIASPGPSHPYYTQNHPPRSSHAQTEPDRGSHPRHEAPPGRYPSPPQARSFGFPQVPPGEQDHHHSKSDCRQEYDSRRPDPPSERENLNGMHGSGSWSDGGGHGPEARAMMNRRHGHGLSESMPFVPSSQDPSSSKWKESQRPIRPSFSMSDLARTESGYARRDRQSMVDHEERDEDEGEYEEEEEEDPEGQEAAFVEEEAPRRPEVSRLSFQHLARPGSQSQPPRSAPPPTPPQHVHSGPSTHDDQVWSRSSGYDEYEYDYDPRSDPRAGAQNASGPGPTVTTPTGHDPRHHGGAQYSHHHRHPSHEYGPPPPQPHHYPHPNQRAQQPYPPSMQHPRQPHGQQPYPHPPQHHYQQHSSQHHSRQAYQYGSHPPQVIMPHHLSGDGSMSGGGVGNRSTPTRRGPYLSRQRALLAGLESTSPSSRYQCQYCHKQFSRPSSLRIHTYSHTGERPFKCSEEGCGRQFSVQSNMRRHLRVHRLGRMRADFGSLDQD
ncbi:hypothetical protein BGZ83_012199 [Gryganskiella cystojenkinii]|nr:hypothetical protein BGZ83_012199 [Gryganskiella cystojenkinii]